MKNAAHIFGKYGEKLAADYLKDKGFIILKQNFRYKRFEIDLIVSKGGYVIFVEVKARKNNLFGNPETFVTPKKIRAIRRAAEHFLRIQKWDIPIRFDTISILGRSPGQVEILHIEDSFY